MAQPSDALKETLDRMFFETVNQVVNLAEEHLFQARHSEEAQMIVHLKMASRAVRCALEICGDRLADKEKKNV